MYVKLAYKILYSHEVLVIYSVKLSLVLVTRMSWAQSPAGTSLVPLVDAVLGQCCSLMGSVPDVYDPMPSDLAPNVLRYSVLYCPLDLSLILSILSRGLCDLPLKINCLAVFSPFDFPCSSATWMWVKLLIFLLSGRAHVWVKKKLLTVQEQI